MLDRALDATERPSEADRPVPDFVGLAESFGLAARRCEGVGDLAQHLEWALGFDVPSVIVLPVDCSIDVAISEELETETVVT